MKHEAQNPTPSAATVPANASRILTTQTKKDHPYWLARTVLLPGWRAKLNRTRQILDGKWHWTEPYWGWKLFWASRNFDAVVTGSEHSALIFTLLQSLFRKKKKPQIVIYTHWNLPDSPLARWLRCVEHRYQARAVARVIVYSGRQLERYANRLRLDKAQLVCVPYHMTTYTGSCAVSDGDYVFSGGDHTRDYRTLIDAVKELPYRVVIAARFRSYFEGLRMPRNVEILTTSHDQFFALMAGARAVVVPLQAGLLHSGGQQTYLNAMAMGKPVIVADDCGADEYIQNGVDGLVVPPARSAALREAIRGVLENDAWARRLGENARRTAANFAPERFMERACEVVEDCVRQSGCAN